jgi:hypothetical protein
MFLLEEQEVLRMVHEMNHVNLKVELEILKGVMDL